MRLFVGFVCSLALAFLGCSESGPGGGGGVGGDGAGGTGGATGGGGCCGGGGIASPFLPGETVTISGDSPFAECTDDAEPGSLYTLDSEVEPWLVVDPTDPQHFVATWQQDRYFADGGCRGQLVGVSFDGGVSWASVTVPGITLCGEGEWVRMTDPWLAFASNGDLYASALGIRDLAFGGAILVSKSTDGGLTWGDPTILEEPGMDYYTDKDSITADTADECVVYAAWSRFDLVNGGGSALFSRTTNCGETWTEPSVIRTETPSPMGLQIVAMPDGSLRAFWVGWSGGEDWESQFDLSVQSSADQGDTWSDPVLIARVRRDPGYSPDAPTRLRGGERFFDVAVDRGSGDLYAVWEQIFAEADRPIQVAFSASSDGGATWSMPSRIDQTPASDVIELEQVFLPSVHVSDDGTLGVTYYNLQNDTPGELPTQTDAWFISCRPGASDCGRRVAWSAQARLTTSSFDFSQAPTTTRGLFIGDYAGLTSHGTDFFAAFSVTAEGDPANVVFVPIREQ